MFIANGATHRTFNTSYHKQTSLLQASMTRLSRGEQIISPGDRPADLGLTERFKHQIRGAEEAGRVTQNAMNMIQSNDSWLGEIHNILNRLNELAISAVDSSKNDDDRKNANEEFQELKSEVARICESGKYNDQQINGKSAITTFDTLSHKITMCQPDGSNVMQLPLNLTPGSSSANGIPYCFSDSTGSYVGDCLSINNGKDLLYIAQDTDATAGITAGQTVMKLNVESNTITTLNLANPGTGTSGSQQPRLVMDEKGHVWVSEPVTGGTGVAFELKRIDVDKMILDPKDPISGGAGAGAGKGKEWTGVPIDMADKFSGFSVHNNYAYYIQDDGAGDFNLVKQNILNAADKPTLLTGLKANYGVVEGSPFSISADGQYLAFTDQANAANYGKINVVNTISREQSSHTDGDKISNVASLDFDKNNNLYWANTGDHNNSNAIKRVSIASGNTPKLGAPKVVHQGIPGQFGSIDQTNAGVNGLNLNARGENPSSNLVFQVGPDESMQIHVSSADVALTSLGVSASHILSKESAQEAITAIKTAVANVATQRAKLGAQLSRLGFTYAANEQYANNMAAAESRIRDVDTAKEAAEMTKLQIAQSRSISMQSKYNEIEMSVLSLLR